MRKHSQALPLFVLVGATAAAVHMAVVFVLVHFAILSPLLANTVGFLLAFVVSFYGHQHLSFASSQAKKDSLPRFLVIALLGFGLNQAAYALLLARVGSNYYLPLLFAVLLGVAVCTYTLSRLWAFRAPDHGRPE